MLAVFGRARRRWWSASGLFREGSSSNLPQAFKIKHYQDESTLVDVTIPMTNEDIAEWISRHLNDKGKASRVVGFDCEWKPAWTKGEHNRVAVVQVATTSAVLLVQLRRMRLPPGGGEFPEALAALINDERVIKTGVGVAEDLKLLKNDFGVKYNGFLDLGAAADRLMRKSRAPDIMNRKPSQRMGLQALAKRFLLVEMSKPNKVRLGNWEKIVLSEEQILYACYDALISIDIHNYLARAGTFDGTQIAETLSSPLVAEYLRCGSRDKMRQLSLLMHESQEMMRLLRNRLLDEDAVWLKDPMSLLGSPLYSTDPILSLATSSWRGALFVFLSRFGYAPKYVAADEYATAVPGAVTGMAEAARRGNLVFTMEVHCMAANRPTRMLSRGTGSSRRHAAEEASRLALQELLELQKSLATDHDLISIYAGKDPMPPRVDDWFDSKPERGSLEASALPNDVIATSLPVEELQ